MSVAFDSANWDNRGVKITVKRGWTTIKTVHTTTAHMLDVAIPITKTANYTVTIGFYKTSSITRNYLYSLKAICDWCGVVVFEENNPAPEYELVDYTTAKNFKGDQGNDAQSFWPSTVEPTDYTLLERQVIPGTCESVRYSDCEAIPVCHGDNLGGQTSDSKCDFWHDFLGRVGTYEYWNWFVDGMVLDADGQWCVEPTTPQTTTYRFEAGQMNGFEVGQTDFDHGTIGELEYAIEPLPAPLSGSSLRVYSRNYSDDQWVYLSKELGPAEGVAPNTTYQARIDVRLASSTPGGCAGVGGAPDSVYIKAGVVDHRP
jgi:hypothetical protein